MRRVARKMLWLLAAVICVASGLAVGQQNRPAGNSGASGFPVDENSIGGVVMNSDGRAPEAGVWVIAETRSLPAPFRKIVVTDEQGRFLVPDLPVAPYELWVRGYGLKDSEPMKISRGERVTIQVANARDPQEAARIYPPSYWTSLIQPPSKEEIPASFTSQDHWIATWKNTCNHCHEIGAIPTRGLTSTSDYEAVFKLSSGMDREARALGLEPLSKSLVDWGTRIRAGEVPPAPPRPVGLERNFVVTQWDWGYPDSFFHDLISTDKRNPTALDTASRTGTRAVRSW